MNRYSQFIYFHRNVIWFGLLNYIFIPFFSVVFIRTYFHVFFSFLFNFMIALSDLWCRYIVVLVIVIHTLGWNFFICGPTEEMCVLLTQKNRMCSYVLMRNLNYHLLLNYISYKWYFPPYNEQIWFHENRLQASISISLCNDPCKIIQHQCVFSHIFLFCSY